MRMLQRLLLASPRRLLLLLVVLLALGLVSRLLQTARLANRDAKTFHSLLLQRMHKRMRQLLRRLQSMMRLLLLLLSLRLQDRVFETLRLPFRHRQFEWKHNNLGILNLLVNPFVDSSRILHSAVSQQNLLTRPLSEQF